MIQRGVRACHLMGLGPPDNFHKKIINLQYTDDILIFLKMDVKMIENLK
jgi:hypothetical protein